MLSWTQHEPSLQHHCSVFIHAFRLQPSLTALHLPHLVHNTLVCTPVFVSVGNLSTYSSARCYFLGILFLCLLTYSYFLFISLPLSWSDHRYNAKQYT